MFVKFNLINELRGMCMHAFTFMHFVLKFTSNRYLLTVTD